MKDLIFNGPKKDFEEMLKSIINDSAKETDDWFDKETCCEICGNARATESGFCPKCDVEISLIAIAIKNASPETKRWLKENIDKVEEILDV